MSSYICNQTQETNITHITAFILPPPPSAYLQKWQILLNINQRFFQFTPLVRLTVELENNSDISLLITGCAYLMCDGHNGSVLWLNELGAHLKISSGIHYIQFIDMENNNYEVYINSITAHHDRQEKMIECAVFRVEQFTPIQPLYPLHIT